MSVRRILVVLTASVGLLVASSASLADIGARYVVELRASTQVADLFEQLKSYDTSKATLTSQAERVQHVRSFRDMGAGQIHYTQTATKGGMPGSMLVRVHGAGGTGWPSPFVLARSLI